MSDRWWVLEEEQDAEAASDRGRDARPVGSAGGGDGSPDAVVDRPVQVRDGGGAERAVRDQRAAHQRAHPALPARRPGGGASRAREPVARRLPDVARRLGDRAAATQGAARGHAAPARARGRSPRGRARARPAGAAGSRLHRARVPPGRAPRRRALERRRLRRRTDAPPLARPRRRPRAAGAARSRSSSRSSTRAPANIVESYAGDAVFEEVLWLVEQPALRRRIEGLIEEVMEPHRSARDLFPSLAREAVEQRVARWQAS